MLMVKDFHPTHYEALKLEELLGHNSLMKGSTQRIYMFPNGYGASVIQGFITNGYPELAVIRFENIVKNIRSGKKRHKMKALKKAGGYHLDYSTPITSDIKRYNNQAELNKDLMKISKLKPY